MRKLGLHESVDDALNSAWRKGFADGFAACFLLMSALFMFYVFLKLIFRS